MQSVAAEGIGDVMLNLMCNIEKHRGEGASIMLKNALELKDDSKKTLSFLLATH